MVISRSRAETSLSVYWRSGWEAELNWHKELKGFSRISHFMTKKIGQIQLPPSQSIEMIGEIIPISDDQDGRENVRARVRKNKQTDEPIFSAVYSSHSDKDRTYMNIALPLYRGVMTGILRPDHNDEGAGLILTSKQLADQRGDEGIYLTFQKIMVKTPLEETFHIFMEEDALKATHKMTCFGLIFLTIEYQLSK